MALKLTTTYKGVTAEYWRINKLTYDDKQDIADVIVALYKDETAKTASLDNELKAVTVRVSGIKTTEIPDELKVITNPRDLLKAMLYAKMSVLPQFEGSESC